MPEPESVNCVELATKLTIAWLANQDPIGNADEVPAFFQKMAATIRAATTNLSSEPDATSGEPETPEYKRAVSVRQSLASKDYILSMIDGKPYRTLKRHLTNRGLTPYEYRQRYGLKHDYPMVAPACSEFRRSVAAKVGLGQIGRGIKRRPPASEPVSPAPAAASAPAPGAIVAAASGPATRALRGRKGPSPAS